MAKPYRALREKMTPENRARAEARAAGDPARPPPRAVRAG
jgi:hypothetical protein